MSKMATDSVGSAGSIRPLVEDSIRSAERLGDILHKLNACNEYRTVPYLDGQGSDQDENRMLQI